MHSFERNFKKKELKEKPFITKVRESYIRLSLFNKIPVLKIKTRRNKKVEQILQKRENIHVIRSVKGEVVCLRKKDEKHEIKALNRIIN